MDDGPQERGLDRTQASLLLALIVFLGLLVSGRGNDLKPSLDRLVMVLAWPIAFGVIMVPRVRPWAPLVVALFLICGGFVLRWDVVLHGGHGSDVLAVTNEALTVLLNGADPYRHVYQSSLPPGAPFPYPPVNLLIHLPGHLVAGLYGMALTELAGAWVVMVVLARFALGRGQVLGMSMLALYVALPNLIELVGDGSNDTSTGAVLVLAVMALASLRSDTPRHAVIAGVLAGCALATKQSTLPIIVATGAWVLRAHPGLFRRYFVALGATLAVVSLPFLAMSGLDYLRALASFAGYHEGVFGWNIWVLAADTGWPIASQSDGLIIGGVTAAIALILVALPSYRSLRTAAASGAVALAVLFFAQRWTSFAYFAQLLSVLVVLPMLPGSGADAWAGGDEPDVHAAPPTEALGAVTAPPVENLAASRTAEGR